MPEIIYVRNERNGRVHKAFREEGAVRIASFEEDNLDDAAHLRILTDTEFEQVEEADLCQNACCFGIVR